MILISSRVVLVVVVLLLLSSFSCDNNNPHIGIKRSSCYCGSQQYRNRQQRYLLMTPIAVLLEISRRDLSLDLLLKKIDQVLKNNFREV